jgi:predicted nucleotidyltransferase
MNLREFDEFRLSDAIHFHDELNHAIFNGDKMKEDVRIQLLNIAEDFIDHLGIQGLDISDITVSGSSAAFTYTKHSDIDLHILVDFNQFKDDDVYRELFDAKKTVYNDSHDITIGGFPVELYVQDTNQPVISLGEYSVMDDKWIKLPRKRRANFDQYATKLKYEKLFRLAEFAYKSNNSKKLHDVVKTLKRYRQAGLDRNGEFGPENLAYKALRSKGIVAKLYDKLQELHNKRLSLPECSGYIPTNSEKNDPRWERALSVDVHPNTMKDQAKKFGWKIKRDGTPPTLRP